MLCPVQRECRAFAEGMQEQLPVKLKKKKQRVESYIVLLLKNYEGKIAIEQRPNEGLLANMRSEEHTSELQSRFDLVCRLLLEKKKERMKTHIYTQHTSARKRPS